MKKQIMNGFTLLEIMIVVVILGILAAIVVPKMLSRPEQARIVKAKQDIYELQSALDLYQLDNGRYPTTDQGLQALVHKPTVSPIPAHWKAGGYINRLPLDPWGHAYQYLTPGVHGDIDIFSFGPHKNQGGKSEIGNWQLGTAKG